MELDINSLGTGAVALAASVAYLKVMMGKHEKQLEELAEDIKEEHDRRIKIEAKLDVVSDEMSKTQTDIRTFLDKFTEPFFKFSANLERVVMDIAEIKRGMENTVKKEDCNKCN